MINFTNFLTESKLDVEKLTHLEHAEDQMINAGHEGMSHTAGAMDDVLDFMSGKKTKTRITTKFDGSPSIVFGINPENGKFFVASKSAFNKNPKINYTPQDIIENHGHAPGLVEKLTAALKMLPRIMPKEGGVYQGDLMYTKPDISDKEGKLSFTPNTITYSADPNSEQGRKVKASELGIVVHTRYRGTTGRHTTLANMVADFNVDQNKFKQDPTVNVISPEVEPPKISGLEKKQYQALTKQATDIYSSMEPDTFDVMSGHDITMKTYINKCIRDETKPTLKGYRQFVEERGQKEIDKAKSEKGKKAKTDDLNTMLSHIDAHKKQFDSIFKLHGIVQQAKDVLVGALSRSSTGYETTIGGKPTKPEGFVAIKDGKPVKLVDRAEFSRSNFLAGAFRKNGEEQVDTEDSPKNPVVFSFGRMNPPTTGHKVLVDKVREVASENKAKHKIVLSASQDPDKNPLSPDEKLKHAKRMFPEANIEVADESAPSVIHQVKKLEEAGHDHLVMVVGSDRVEEMKKLLDGYNGKEFNFKKIDVVSAGQRDPDADDEDPTSMSASRQRASAINGKRKEFAKGVPTTMHPEHAEELYNDVRRRMLDIKIDASTNGISLARYAKRQDPVGVRARREVQRRLIEKEAQKAAKRAAKPKSKSIAPIAPVTKPKPIKESYINNIIERFIRR